ncbi:MAG: DoxX family protein [Pirellulaceae bacterium]|nr:DoxX family protein [Pirellulaceae bacterium]
MSGSKTSRIIGWVLSALVAALLLGPSAMGKFTEWEGKAETFQKMGFTTELMFKIGIVEVAVAILYLIPQTAFIGAILLTGYLGGAVVTHLRVDEPFLMPIVVGVVAWIGLGLRQQGIFGLACRACNSESCKPPGS